MLSSARPGDSICVTGAAFWRWRGRGVTGVALWRLFVDFVAGAVPSASECFACVAGATCSTCLRKNKKHKQRRNQGGQIDICKTGAGTHQGVPSCIQSSSIASLAWLRGDRHAPCGKWRQGILPLRTHTPLKEGRESFFRGKNRRPKPGEDPNRKQTEQGNPKETERPQVGSPRAKPQTRNKNNGEARLRVSEGNNPKQRKTT